MRIGIPVPNYRFGSVFVGMSIVKKNHAKWLDLRSISFLLSTYHSDDVFVAWYFLQQHRFAIKITMNDQTVD